MSDDWINHVIARMAKTENPEEIKDLAVIIKSAFDQGKVTKVVTGIDKHKNEIQVLTLQ